MAEEALFGNSHGREPPARRGRAYQTGSLPIQAAPIEALSQLPRVGPLSPLWIREKLDQWLDRVVDRILAAPAPGTAAWRQAWRERDNPTGRATEHRRLLTRIAVAQRAGIDPDPDIRRALAAGIPAGDLPTALRASRRTRRTTHGDNDTQYTML